MSAETEQTATKPAPVVLKGLRPESFAHPLDTQLRAALSSLPLVQPLLRQLFALAEQTFILELLSSSVKVGDQQMPSLHRLVGESCRILDMPQVPDLYVKSSPVPNAYTLAVGGRKPFVVIHSSLVDMLTEKEIQAVIAHELGHLKCEHGLWVTLLNLLLQGLGDVPAVAMPLQSLLLRWQRSAEYTCDRAAVLVTQDVDTVASVFLKLSGGNARYGKELSVSGFLKQAEEFESETRKADGVVGRLFTTLVEQQATHPLAVQRVKELDSFFRSSAYRGILSRADKRN